MTDTDMTFQTWCIGRHTVEVPAHFVPVDSFGSIAGMKVMQLGPGDERALEALVRQRALDLTEARYDYDEMGPILFRGAYHDGEIHVLAHESDLGQDPGTAELWTEEAHLISNSIMMRVEKVMTEETQSVAQAQMLDLARKITPHRRDLVPSGPGACLPEALAMVPMGSENHNMTFVPKDANGAPVGIRITIVAHSPSESPLDPRLPSGPGERRIEIAGMKGIVVEAPPRIGHSKIAVVHRPAEAQRSALRIQVYYYDERPPAEAPPDAAEQAKVIFDRAVTSMRARSAEE